MMRCAARNKFSLDAARPQNQVYPVDWDDKFVTDLQRGLIACRIFAFYPILWVCHLQINNNLVSQAAQMDTHGLPNDIFPVLNPISVLALLPVVTNLVYPALRKMGVHFPPVNRMATGFLIEAAAIAYCAGVQRLIYSKAPCFDYALECDASEGGRIPNQISVWVQTPVYVLDGLAEVFFDVVSQEYAYNKAPDNVRSLERSKCTTYADHNRPLADEVHRAGCAVRNGRYRCCAGLSIVPDCSEPSPCLDVHRSCCRYLYSSGRFLAIVPQIQCWRFRDEQT
jgi:POT family proton-dependent oligopeptide transporter